MKAHIETGFNVGPNQCSLRFIASTLVFHQKLSNQPTKMNSRFNFKSISTLLIVVAVVNVFTLFNSVSASAKKAKDVTELQIGVKYRPETCEVKAHKGDRVKVHYRGQLTNGTVFDSSYERGDPFEFVLGSGQVIKGWDQGILGMCLKEKRKLKIPAKLGYGEQGSPPTIPGGATLIFDTELMEVNADEPEDFADELPGGDDNDEEDNFNDSGL